MNDSRLIELTILWFVVLIFIQTGSDSANGLIRAIGLLALVLAYIIPFVILGLLILRVKRE